MVRLRGKTVCQGIAAGPVYVWAKQGCQAGSRRAGEPEAEIGRVHAAVEQARAQLACLYRKAVREVGAEGAAIFEAQQMLLEDEEYLDAVCSIIRREQVNAEYAVAAAGAHFAGILAGMEDEAVKARAADVEDVSSRLAECLTGHCGGEPAFTEPAILVADDISPSETIRMDRGKILALVTAHGTANSHSAILARMMNIPALAGVPMEAGAVRTGMQAVADGFQGEFILEPSPEICRYAGQRMREEQRKRLLLETLKGKESVTLDGKKIGVCANAGNMDDIRCALENDAEGIGLFRSEFLYLGRDALPTEEEQFQVYRQAVRAMAGRKVVIRTLDVGADKNVGYLGLGQEENPALGYRAIRICLREPLVFKAQLRALLRAAAWGDLSILYPMITSTEEVRRIFGMVEEAGEELEKAGIPYRVPRQGVMIETPAAVMISDELAGLADFFSIGTNDLTQYALAVDRQNEKLDEFYNPRHKAVLKMIRMAVDNAHRCGKKAGICGELGADLALAEEFARMGVDELSVPPSMVLEVRKAVREART